MQANIPTLAPNGVTAAGLIARALASLVRALPQPWPADRLPVPEVMESTWADWIAAEAKFKVN